MLALDVNGTVHQLDVDPEAPLLWVLRDDLGLTGTKFGCGIAQCGACTVQVDGEPRRACSTPVKAVVGKKVTTIEGLTSKASKAVQDAWIRLDVVQCGYCQSGQVMSAASLLEKKPRPTEEDVHHAMTGNLCRCATYQRIRAAVYEASKTLGG